MTRRAILAGVLCVALAGCGGVQSALAPAGSEAAHIGGLLGLFFWVTLGVYVFVLACLGLAVLRGRAGGSGVQGEPAAGAEPGWHLALALFAGATALILLVLSVATWLTDRSIAREAVNPAVEVEVIGHQWWWEVRYDDPVAGRTVRTANELVIPAGAVTHVALSSTDVIHSLWIPNLAGKQDLIPGRNSDLALKPARSGRFRAQCAEFCGLQHAHMALDVTVLAPADYARWYEAQLKTPPAPTGGPEFAGYSLFLGRQCSSCHTIGGTPASGQVAPDLTHVASRRTIAAGTLPATRAGFDAWIADPQAAKPGNAMPRVPLSDAERAAVVAYLESLK